MLEFGLSPAGFNRKRLDDIKAEIEQEVTTLLGPVNMDPDSVLGQLIGVVSKSIADIWEQAENVYFSQYPATAEGSSLDNSVDLIGIKRLEETKSRIQAWVSGAQSSLIPAGSLIKLAETDDLFTNPVDGIITQSNALKARLTVSNVLPSYDYIVVLNGETFTFTSSISPTITNIAEGLVAEINDEVEDPIEATVISAGVFDLVSTSTEIFEEITFNLVAGTNLTVTSRTSPLEFQAVEPGPTLVLPDTATGIVTPVGGWEAVTNPEEGIIGRNTETDQELRARRLQSIRILGAASVEAIRAKLLQEVESVTNVFIYENRTQFTDEFDRPPHSFEAVVVGGAEEDIIQKIWEVKAAGIQTWGNESGLITDSNGDQQEIKYSRPTSVYVWINVELTPIDGVAFPTNGLVDVANAILAYSANFNVSDDVIYQQFFAPVYAVAGPYIMNVAITMATSATEEGPPGSYTAANVEIEQVEIAKFALDRINVELDT